MEQDASVRIGQAAALLGVSVDTLRRWEESGAVRVERTPGGQRRIPVGEVQRLLDDRRLPQPEVIASSARNQLEAVVTRVVSDRAAATVEMQAGPYRLVALTTAESVEELGLAPGTPVVASVKATSVLVNLAKQAR